MLVDDRRPGRDVRDDPVRRGHARVRLRVDVVEGNRIEGRRGDHDPRRGEEQPPDPARGRRARRPRRRTGTGRSARDIGRCARSASPCRRRRRARTRRASRARVHAAASTSRSRRRASRTPARPVRTSSNARPPSAASPSATPSCQTTRFSQRPPQARREQPLVRRRIEELAVGRLPLRLEHPAEVRIQRRRRASSSARTCTARQRGTRRTR